MTKAQRLKWLKIISFNAGLAMALLVLTFAKVDNRVAPFAVAFLFACVILRVNKVGIGLCVFLFSLFVVDGRQDIIASIVAVATFFMLAWCLPILKQKYGARKVWRKYKLEYAVIFFLYMASNIAGIFFAWGDLLGLYSAGVNFAIGTVFLASCLMFFNATGTRGGRIPWTPDQRICAGVFIVVLSLGLMGLRYDYFNLHKFVSVFVILIAASMLDSRTAMVVAACLGLGASLQSLDLIYVSTYTLLAMAAVSFKCSTKYLSIIAVMVTDVVLGFYFRAYYGYGVFDVLPLALACLGALVLPRAVSKYFDFSKSILSGYLVSKNTINKNRAGVYRRLDNLGSVFNEMQNIYKNLVTGSVPREESAKMLARRLCDNVCSSCEHRPKCKRDANAAKDIDDGFEKLCFIGLGRGNVNFMDITPDMSLKCTKLNAVLNSANSYVSQIQTQETSRMKTDAGKVLMAGLLSGLHRLCKNFAVELGSEVVFDIEKGAEIKDALLGAGIVASDVLITKNRDGEYNVSVLVPRAEAQNLAIERVISKIAGHRMAVDTIDDAETAGFSIVTVKTAPKYGLTFGIAQVSKDFNPQNGDAFSFLKITSDKTMMSVCDGMGTGEKARRASVLALSLVENFYKAGFPNEIIVESVNQLLIITGQEGFSAVDIAVFSLSDGEVNFIKVGGVEGFIKRAREIEVIEAGSLPLGIVEEMVPKITRAHLHPGDYAVICSDGVLDSFSDRVALANFINNSSAKTPQKLADEIVSECLKRTDKIAIDDCTVAVARLDSTVDKSFVLPYNASYGKEKSY
ncbi:MAG: serine/threonine-protein phosphatase [Christensenellaceae bacterium]|jgi:stage II sporulation protein E|nr:serine/threonine-protein phosphatase [Christensenellaceae bacterium]